MTGTADAIVVVRAMTTGLACQALMRAVPVHPTVSDLIPALLTGLRQIGEQPG